MKKVTKLRSIIDPDGNNMDDIYANIVNELNLGTNPTDVKPNFKVPPIPSKGSNARNVSGTTQNPPYKKVNDSDLLLSMTKRLNLVEAKWKDVSLDNNNKDIEIKRLKKEIAEYQCSNCEKLNQKISQQHDYIDKLYTFLKENGITIINSATNPSAKNDLDIKLKSLESEWNDWYEEGEEIERNDEIVDINAPYQNCKPKATQAKDVSDTLPRTIDIKTLIRRIEEMNSLIYDEGGASANFESEDGKVFKLKQRKEIAITFFKNGLVIEGYQFLAYTGVTAQKIIGDIVDGYSPYILKDRYPNGVIMKVVNNVANDHVECTNKNNNFKNILDTGEKKKLTGKEFVQMFPDKFIKNGKIHNIREDMESFLNCKTGNNPGDLDTEKDNFIWYDSQLPLKEEEIAKIKMKIVICDKVINLQAKKDMKVKELFDFVQKYTNQILGKTSALLRLKTLSDYGWIMTYPYKVIKYDCDDTLFGVGLYPSLFVTFDKL